MRWVGSVTSGKINLADSISRRDGLTILVIAMMIVGIDVNLEETKDETTAGTTDGMIVETIAEMTDGTAGTRGARIGETTAMVTDVIENLATPKIHLLEIQYVSEARRSERQELH